MDRDNHPKIENAPGLVWKPRKAAWEARWQARSDLTRRGFRPTSIQIWKGVVPSEVEAMLIADTCRTMQNKMLLWAADFTEQVAAFDGSVRGLIDCYQTDPDSPFRKLRYPTRVNYGRLLARLKTDAGDLQVTELRGRAILRLHEGWIGFDPANPDAPLKISMGHSMVAITRILMNFGATILENEDCRLVADDLSKRKFENSKSSQEILSVEQVVAVRAQLHRDGWHSLALGQAIQFDCTWRQKDAIGEYVPLNEPGISDVIYGNKKWLRGVRWEEIGPHMILTHTTSKKQKPSVVNLNFAEMVLEELRIMLGLPAGAVITRSMLPASGPIVVCEATRMPWVDATYREKWRKAARACGIPDGVCNMHSRHIAITEGIEATGGDIDSVRIAATHSQISTTVGYSRNDARRTEKVQQQRAAYRNKSRTGGTGTDGDRE